MDGGDESGLLQVRAGLIPADLIAEAVGTLCDLVTAAGGPGQGDLDARVTALAEKDRAALGAVYDAMREAAVFRRIVTCEPLLAAARQALGATRLHSPFQHCVFRMDLAGEPWRGFGWHQDYAYNMMSQDYVTAWLPLTDTGAHNGSIDAAPTLSGRIHPVEIRFKRDEQGRRGATRDAFIAGRFHAGFEAAAVKLELAAGDVALFRNRLVHRSGFNPGPRHRYSVQVRFGDLMAPEVAGRRWANRRADGFDTFKALHPELVEFEEDAMIPADETLRELLRRHIDEPDLIANLGSFGRRMHFMKAFAHYEVFKLVEDIPGDIVECGVYKGSSLLSFARFLETFCPGDRTRKVLGFDHFKGLADRSEKDGLDDRVGNNADGWNPSSFRDTLFALVDAFNADAFVTSRKRIELVDGDVRETAPAYVADNPGLRISLLHLDMDLYEPTLVALKAFWPRILTGGVVLLDEYAIREWPGESEALEEFFEGRPPRIEKFGWASAPGGFFVKE